MFDGNWHCIEWLVDGADQAYQFFSKGTEVAADPDQERRRQLRQRQRPRPSAGVLTTSRVSWITYQDAPPGFTAWVDEVAIDPQRIGCGN